MKANSIISILLLGIFLTGCSSLGKIQLEVMRPPDNLDALSISEISITNGFLQKNAKRKGEFKNLIQYDKYRLDSLVSVESIRALHETLDDAGKLHLGIIDSLGHADIKGSYVSLEQVDVKSEVETEPMYVYSKGAYYAAVRVPYKIKWKIQLADSKPSFIAYQDTLWAEGYAVTFSNLSELVRFNSVIEYIISKTSFALARKISPVWEQTSRYYYRSGNNDFLRAGYFVDNQQYDEAALLWQKYANGKGNLSSNALLNLAVYHELKGDIDEAIIFCEKAVALKNELAVKYLKVLKNRQSEVKKILKK